jgi:hypothetical protein
MKIKDIISEEVDMSWMADIDADFNPEALQSVEQQEKRQQMINKMAKGTTVFHKPIRKSETSFSNIPPKDQPKSPGYVGRVHTAVRADIMTDARGQELTEIS